MMSRGVNGQWRDRRWAAWVVGVAFATVLAGCPTVYRYGPDEDASPLRDRYPARSRPVKVTTSDGTRSRPTPVAHGDLAAQLGDGTLASELAAAARRLVGFRFPDDDAGAFARHLKTVAVWRGATTPVAAPHAGDLWQGAGGRLAVVQGPGAGRSWIVIGPRRGGVVERFEVDGGTFQRAIDGVATN